MLVKLLNFVRSNNSIKFQKIKCQKIIEIRSHVCAPSIFSFVNTG